MRFKISHENIEIDPTPEGTESVVLALTNVLVPRWASRLYFTTRRQQTYPVLEQRCLERRDLSVLDYDHSCDHILDKFRIIEDQDGSLCVADAPGRLTVKDRKQICHRLVELLR